jgi:hypothetical protein
VTEVRGVSCQRGLFFCERACVYPPSLTAPDTLFFFQRPPFISTISDTSDIEMYTTRYLYMSHRSHLPSDPQTSSGPHLTLACDV